MLLGAALAACQPTLPRRSSLSDPFAPEMAPADDSRMPPELRAAYRGLADDLALALTERERAPAFPSDWAASVHAALVRVDQHEGDAGWARGREAWRQRLLEADFTFVGRRIQLATGPAARWAEAWRQGAQVTGHERVDALVRDFGYAVAQDRFPLYLGDATGGWTLTSTEQWHTVAVAAMWKSIDGVLRVEPDPEWPMYSWGNPYNLSLDCAVDARPGPGWRLTVYQGWGDCEAGCISGHAFAFNVTPDGAVTLEHEGDAVP